MHPPSLSTEAALKRCGTASDLDLTSPLLTELMRMPHHHQQARQVGQRARAVVERRAQACMKAGRSSRSSGG